MVGPPQAVNVSLIERADEVPGSFTCIESTTGHVCSPLEGTSLDCTMNPTPATLPGDTVNRAGATPNAGACPVVRTVVGSVAGWAPFSPPMSEIPGRPSREHGVFDVLTTPTGLKIEPAAPPPSSALSVTWFAVQGEGGPGTVAVVVVEEVLVVDVVAASVVDVVVVVGIVVVVGLAAREQAPTTAARPTIIMSRLAIADLERRMGLLAVATGSQARAT